MITDSRDEDTSGLRSRRADCSTSHPMSRTERPVASSQEAFSDDRDLLGMSAKVTEAQAKAKCWHVQQSYTLACLSSCIKEFVPLTRWTSVADVEKTLGIW